MTFLSFNSNSQSCFLESSQLYEDCNNSSPIEIKSALSLYFNNGPNITYSVQIWGNGGFLIDTLLVMPYAQLHLFDISNGFYFVGIVDNLGQSCVDSIIINAPFFSSLYTSMPLDLNYNTTSASCLTCNDGSVQLSFSGGWYHNAPTYTFNGSVIPTYGAPLTGFFGTANNLTPGVYIATVTDSLGCSSSKTITIGAAPAGCVKPGAISLGTSSSTKLCPNDSVTIEIVSPPDSVNYTYQWTRNGNNVFGATARSIIVNDVAKYKVFVSTGPGINCQRVSGLVETTANLAPSVFISAPTGTTYCPGDSILLTVNGTVLGYEYRWKRYGVVIPGATSGSFFANQPGNYRCEIFNSGGCINQSNLISIVNSTNCRVGEMNSDIFVFPNPSCEYITVSFIDIGDEKPVYIDLCDSRGHLIQRKTCSDLSDVVLNVGMLASGSYTVRIFLASGDSIDKIVLVD